ncbi:hypothetical protein [Aliikangiella sp. IMCC44359]|uniref:hypothetical protein n=1 Tax=Aliikangiella sp. IMCC44359 TaxID=3459125 RepID=UPI00403A8128
MSVSIICEKSSNGRDLNNTLNDRPIKVSFIAKSLSIGIEKSQGLLSLLRCLTQCIAALWTSQTTKRAAKITAFIVTIDSDLAICGPQLFLYHHAGSKLFLMMVKTGKQIG